MAGDEHGETQREGELRRRRSTHRDDEMTGVEEAGADSREDFGPPRRAFSEPIDTLATIGSDNDTAGTPPGPSHSTTPRVRFSAQLDGTDVSSSKNDDDGRQDIGTRSPDEVLERDISGSVSPTGFGGGQFGAVENAQRYQAYGARADPPQRSSTAPAKPRNRGYSLRRSIFNRNIHSQSDDVGTVIELEQTGSSRQTPPVNTRPSPQTKKSEASVTISPIIKEDDLALTPQTSKTTAILSSLPNYEYWVQKRRAQGGIITKLKTIRTQIRKKFLRMTEITPSKDGRHIDLDSLRETLLIDERTTRPYIDNTIRSSRYTFWSFFPRQLIAQFSKLANFYFLCVSVLQMIPNLSTTGRYTTILPLLFFVGISMGKEGYDDLRRSRLDKEENNRTAAVFHPSHASAQPEDHDSESPATWTDTKWQDIRVGDILKLGRDEAIPADIALLHADGPNGVAYIETMALDGETNLKSKQPALPNSNRSKSVTELLSSQAHFVVEDPNIDLYRFEGRVTVGEETLPLTNNEIVYRGSVLRNTHKAFGLVIYSGEECKIRMNATKNPRIKAPTLQSMVNKVVIVIVCFVIALSVFNTAAYQIWSERVEERSFYLANAGVAFFPILASFIIMFNTMIPLSLYVSLEIVKLAQMFLLNDVDMYDKESNTPMEPRTSTINEELGQVR
jgi:phospholipid-translocating ATPase